MNYIKLTLGIFTVLAVNGYPPSPKFYKLIALSFYVPAIFGKDYTNSLNKFFNN